MVSLLTVIAVSIIVIGITYLIITRNPSKAERTYHKVDFLRQVVGAVFVVLAVWTFLQSGDPLLIAFAIAGLAFVTAYILVEKPHKEIA